jgi:uncharacterized Rossmann fold enzyme
MIPLSLHVKPAGTVEGIRANVQAALARNLPEMAPGIVAHDGTMVVVGSGPSMPEHVEEIRAERELGRPIFAVKGAHDFLCKAGLQPDLWLCVDPRDRAYLLEEANDYTTYLISSRCDASMFEALSNRRVLLVHTWAKEEHCEEYNGKLLIGGGTTSGLRAITVSYILGFRKIVLYGFDSCVAKDRSTKRFTGEGVEKHKLIDVIVDGRRFWTNGAMAQQANEFQTYYQVMPGLQIEAKGDGLIAAILKARKRRGYAA